MITSFLCKLSGHAVDRRRVWFDNVDYRTSCKRCSAHLVRAADGWREFDIGHDGEAGRLPHPKSRVNA